MKPSINKPTYDWLMAVSASLKNAANEGSPEYVEFILRKLREDLEVISKELGRNSNDT